MKLSTRLQKLLDLTSENSILADIGSDHGYLCIAYVNQKDGQKAYACDINQNALNQAKKALEKYPSEKVELQLMDGIENLKSDVKEIVIAGMGFDTIKLILASHYDKLKGLDKIIIQCNKNIDKLKAFLNEEKIYINEEHLVLDNQIFYEILVCSVNNSQLLRPITLDDQYYDYLDYQLDKIKKIEDFNSIPELKEKFDALQQVRSKKNN